MKYLKLFTLLNKTRKFVGYSFLLCLLCFILYAKPYHHQKTPFVTQVFHAQLFNTVKQKEEVKNA